MFIPSVLFHKLLWIWLKSLFWGFIFFTSSCEIIFHFITAELIFIWNSNFHDYVCKQKISMLVWRSWTMVAVSVNNSKFGFIYVEKILLQWKKKYFFYRNSSSTWVSKPVMTHYCLKPMGTVAREAQIFNSN